MLLSRVFLFYAPRFARGYGAAHRPPGVLVASYLGGFAARSSQAQRPSAFSAQHRARQIAALLLARSVLCACVRLMARLLPARYAPQGAALVWRPAGRRCALVPRAGGWLPSFLGLPPAVPASAACGRRKAPNLRAEPSAHPSHFLGLRPRPNRYSSSGKALSRLRSDG